MTKKTQKGGRTVAVVAACNLHFSPMSLQEKFVEIKFKMRDNYLKEIFLWVYFH